MEFVRARNVFNANNMAASVGAYAFGFTWAAVVCLFIASVLFFGGCITGRYTGDNVNSTRRGFFGRSRSTKSRGSFVKEETY